MKKLTVLLLLLVLFVLTATVSANPGQKKLFTAHLAGAFEVPAVATVSTGQAIFHLSADGSSLHYKLIVANLEDTLQAHIHLAPIGTNGSVVAFLYPEAPPPILIPGGFSGVLAEGDITAADLRGPLAGLTIQDLVAEMVAGNTYVNVHTVENPGGEIRGQIR
jgi:hypothetical protein